MTHELLDQLARTGSAQIELTGPAAELTAADDDGPLRGTAVPYGELGVTSLGPVRIARGALPVDLSARGEPIPFVLDHDLSRPVGVVAELVDSDERLTFAVALDPIPEAATVRAQVRSRSRPGASVGLNILTAELGDDGVPVVTAAEWVELSSVVRPAFTSAVLAAARASKKSTEPDPGPSEEEPPMIDTTESTDDAPARVPGHVAAPSNVSIAPNLRAMAGSVMRELRAAGQIDTHSLAAAINRQSAELTAALADVTTTQLPPAGTWLGDVDNFIALGMPTVEAFEQRPTDRWPIHQRQRTVVPVPGKQAAEKQESATNAMASEYVRIDGATYSWAADFSVQVIEDNGEQVIEDDLAEVAEYVGQLIEADAIAALVAAAQAGGTSGIDLSSLGSAIGAVATSGLMPDRVVVSGDQFGVVWELLHTGGPGIMGALGGELPVPRVVLSPAAPAGTCIVGSSRAFRTYLSSTGRLRAVNVPNLGVDVAVYRRASFRVRKAAALVKITSA